MSDFYIQPVLDNPRFSDVYRFRSDELSTNSATVLKMADRRYVLLTKVASGFVSFCPDLHAAYGNSKLIAETSNLH